MLKLGGATVRTQKIHAQEVEDALEALKNPRAVPFTDLLKICSRFFERPRIRGSHHIFKVPWQGPPWLNIQKDAKMAKVYQVKQVKQALEKLRGDVQ